MVFPYLFYRIPYRAFMFFRHWYADGFRVYWNFLIHALLEFERAFAWRITARHVLEPLYGDFSLVGYVVGIPFRIVKVVLGAFFYVVFLFALALIFLVWMFVPPYVLFRIVAG